MMPMAVYVLFQLPCGSLPGISSARWNKRATNLLSLYGEPRLKFNCSRLSTYYHWCSGGGIGGLCLAIALSRYPDIDVQVYEAASTFKEIGAGIMIWGRSWHILSLLGLRDSLFELVKEQAVDNRGKPRWLYATPFGAYVDDRSCLWLRLSQI